MNKLIILILGITFPPFLLGDLYYTRQTTGTGRNRRMEAPRTYRHSWDRSDRWFNNRWWDEKEFPLGLNNDPSVDQYSDTDCPGCMD